MPDRTAPLLRHPLGLSGMGLALVLALSACSTGTEQQARITESRMEADTTQLISCETTLANQPTYDHLRALTPLVPPFAMTVSQADNPQRASSYEAAQLGVWHQQFNMCRTQLIEDAQVQFPFLLAPIAENMQREDAVYTGVVQGTLPWGTANQMLATIHEQTKNAYAQSIAQWSQGMYWINQGELNRREQALEAAGVIAGTAIAVATTPH